MAKTCAVQQSASRRLSYQCQPTSTSKADLYFVDNRGRCYSDPASQTKLNSAQASFPDLPRSYRSKSHVASSELRNTSQEDDIPLTRESHSACSLSTNTHSSEPVDFPTGITEQGGMVCSASSSQGNFLNLDLNQIQSHGMKINSAENITALTVYGCSPGPEDITALAALLKQMLNVKELRLCGMGLQDEQLLKLLPSLQTLASKKLTLLSLEDNHITIVGVLSLFGLVLESPNLKVLNLRSNHIDESHQCLGRLHSREGLQVEL